MSETTCWQHAVSDIHTIYPSAMSSRHMWREEGPVCTDILTAAKIEKALGWTKELCQRFLPLPNVGRGITKNYSIV